MKSKETKKQIKESFSRTISVGYCEAQYLLYFKDPVAYYSTGPGWDCDFYDINGVCISTGYRPIGDKIDYKKLCELERQATNIICNYSLSVDFKKQKIDELLNKLINL